MRKLVEDQPSISVHRLYRARALHPGAVTQWDWAGRIVELRAESMRAVFTIDGVVIAVPLRWHPGTLGGEWPSWQCRCCGRGAYRVYGEQLLCWRCARLGHATKSQPVARVMGGIASTPQARSATPRPRAGEGTA
jgi:hypothetical protein